MGPKLWYRELEALQHVSGFGVCFEFVTCKVGVEEC